MKDNSPILIYTTDNKKTTIEVLLKHENVWLSQSQMAELFQKDRTVISRHIQNIFKEGELEPEVVSAKFAHTTKHGAIEGKTRPQDGRKQPQNPLHRPHKVKQRERPYITRSPYNKYP